MTDQSRPTTHASSKPPALSVAAWMIGRCVRVGPAAEPEPSTNDSKISDLQLATWRQRSSQGLGTEVQKSPTP